MALSKWKICFGNLALFDENAGGEIPGVVIIRVDAQGVAQGKLGVIGFAGIRQNFGEPS